MGVKLECRDREGGNLTYSTEAATNKTGTYSIPVDGDHENEICDVALVKSSRDDCSEISHDLFLKKTARISLTKNNGIATPVRLANPLGFLKKVPLPEQEGPLGARDHRFRPRMKKINYL